MSAGQSKKGISIAVGFFGAIIILLVSASVLYGGIKYMATKFDENYQVGQCRFLNEIKYGFREKSKDVLTSGESICATINKHTYEKTFVPTTKYKQNKEGAEREIKDMIMNCWYMWLDGTKPNMFRGYPLTESCFTCYTFKIKDDVRGVTYSSISQLLEEPHIAKDTSDGCVSGGGGKWRSQCQPDEKAVQPKTTPADPSTKCCSKGLRNECENKGGKCSEGFPSDVSSDTYAIYDNWLCPRSNQNCYVKKDSHFSYINYIRKFNDRGGDVIFKPPSGETSDFAFASGEIYAISFISPSKQICLKGQEEGARCYAMIGTYVIVGGGALAASYVFVPVALAGTAVKVVVTKAISLLAGNIVSTAFLAKLGVFSNLAKEGADFVMSGITIDVPNYVIVSTLKDAQDPQGLGCAVDYGV